MPEPRPKRRANKPPANSPAPTGRKTSAQGKAHRAAALGSRIPKNPSPARATQNAEATGLPPGWATTTLGEICAPSRARAHPQDEPDLPYVGLEHVESQTMRLLGRGKTSDLKSSSVRFSEGDVLYGKMRPYLNKVWLAEFDGLCSAEFLVFPKTEGLNSQLFAYRLNSDDFVKFANRQVSGDRPRVDFDKLASFPYPLAPTAEQDRIIAKLDAVLSRIAAGEAAAQRALKRLDSYRAAVLHAAVTGELTREWRKTHEPKETGAQLLKRLLDERRARWEEAELERFHAAGIIPNDDKWKERYPRPTKVDASKLPELPEGWTWISLDQLTIHLTSGSRDWTRYYGKGSGTFLMAQNIRKNGLDLSFRQAVDPPPGNRDCQRSQVAKGDILVTIVGANTGDVCVVPIELTEHYVCQSVALLRLATPSLSHFVWLYLASDQDGQKQWRMMTYGAGRPHLGFEHLRLTAIPVPPCIEQAAIVREVGQRLAAADRLSVTLNHQLAHARAARQAVMREAFAGRLVPQNPDDAQASEMLPRQSKDSSRAVTRSRSKSQNSPRRRRTEGLVFQP